MPQASHFRLPVWIVVVAALAAGTALAAPAGTDAEPGLASLDPPVLLPDGAEFKSWARPPVYAKTYYVDQAHPQASDQNPGTQEKPFRTINRAAQALQPGERVVVAAGLYRERVRPARGGTGPDRMIGYEAAPGAKVVLSGSQAVPGPWKPSTKNSPAAGAKVWMTGLAQELFPEENPFKEQNLTDAMIDRAMDWAIPTKGKAPNTLRRGLVFQDGRRLKQVAAFERLADAPGAYWVEPDGLAIHVRPAGDVDPTKARFEVTVRGFIFAPDAYGLGYIRLSGFCVEHAGNCFPRPQHGAISTQRGHHWIIERNTVRQCNAIGIDIGDQFDVAGPKLAQGGRHIVRRNTITDCGIGGIEGPWIEDTLIEENVIRRCGWHDCWRIYECGGIKVHCTHSCLVRRNLVTDTVSAPGIWMDYTNVNSRCTSNVVLDGQCETGAIFMEASQRPNLVDNNIVWGNRGNGIYQHDCDELVIAHNLVAHSSDAGVRMQVCQGREVNGRLSTAKRNRIVANVLIANRAPFAISDPDNVLDYNVIAAADAASAGGPNSKPFDLAAWQKEHGWDRHSAVMAIEAALDPRGLELSFKVARPLPECPAVPRVTHDFIGRPRPGPMTTPGPFAVAPPGPSKLSVNPIASSR